jgi:hypothetical protein
MASRGTEANWARRTSPVRVISGSQATFQLGQTGADGGRGDAQFASQCREAAVLDQVNKKPQIGDIVHLLI